ncbi:MAG: Asp-tRNA(Asn)/Glu-tRNA(Gln) amidotransferase subunit GatA [Anaerolineae bacterium]|nr:Asp-tRNA(Asn)/Glu-tRNA(Gln) amidotransferase subunit GatA [Anaerolineae bacterium]
MALCDLTAHEALDLLRSGEITSVALTASALDRILAVDNDVCAYLTLTPEQALAEASAADALRRAGQDLPLLGIPVAFKDNLSTRGIPTSCGSRMLDGYVPPYDATVVRRVKEAGAVVLGKTNMDAFAMGSSTENSAFFPTHNPWDLARVPGGSSGGSAAAVAAGEALLALGSDTGGSVRQPAALCGVVGVRPTYGLCSRYGLIAFASSLDQVGPVARDVTDAALLLGVIAGHDPADSTSRLDSGSDYTAYLARKDLAGLRVGVLQSHPEDGIQAEVADATRRALKTLRDLGAELVDVSLPHGVYALSTYYLIAPAEASANLARFDGVRYGFRAAADTVEALFSRARGAGFGPEVKRRIMLGTYALSAGYYEAFYIQAQKVRTLIRADFDAAFEAVDVIVGPTSPTTAFMLGERVADPLEMYRADALTLSQALAGIPAISVPCGFDAAGLPVGLQITAPEMQELRMLQVAFAFEQATDWHRRRPSLIESS